ncbi:MAG: tRNA pseudouridine(38-40) synthase TruA [Planctomycetota bacterium]
MLSDAAGADEAPQRNLELTIEYTGAGFAGWQVQPDRRTVAGELERALAEILRHPVRLVAASRTDAGVHALGQVASFQTGRDLPCGRLCRGLNALLPDDVAVRQVREVPAEFHARFSARGKHYRYRLFNRPSPSPLEAWRSWHVPVPLDLEAMRAAARELEGERDFAALVTRPDPERGTVRHLRAVRLRREPASEGGPEAGGPEEGATVLVDVVGDSFLYKMVRTLVGTLCQVGQGKATAAEVAAALATGRRAQAGPTAPAQGLTLMRVFYDDRQLQARAAELRDEPARGQDPGRPTTGSVDEHHGDGARNRGARRAEGVRRAEGREAGALP